LGLFKPQLTQQNYSKNSPLNCYKFYNAGFFWEGQGKSERGIDIVVLIEESDGVRTVLLNKIK